MVALPAMAAALDGAYRSRLNPAEARAFATYVLAQIRLGVMLLAGMSG